MSDAPFRAVERCRVCGSSSFDPVLSLGETPLANAFVPPELAGEPDARFPLHAIRCRGCCLVQLSVVVRPDVLFGHYLYSSSASDPMVRHFRAYADEVVDRFAPPGSLVVEIGSNDGVLLRPLAERGVRAVGVEPAENLARTANAAGLETRNEFFGPEAAREIERSRGRAAAVLANNVLAHIDDLHAVLEGLDALLLDDGVLVAEFPYLGDLLDRVEYDTIYHEHLSYFGLAPISVLLATAGFELFDARPLGIHGGSLRVYAGRRGQRPAADGLREALRREQDLGLEGDEAYARFRSRVSASRDALRELLADLAAAGRTIAGLGATAKSTTLLNYCGIGKDVVRWIADSTPLKHGLLTPGTRIPIRPERTIVDERPDYTLLLAWNYADVIVERFTDYRSAGGRFIHPIPSARVLGS